MVRPTPPKCYNLWSKCSLCWLFLNVLMFGFTFFNVCFRVLLRIRLFLFKMNSCKMKRLTILNKGSMPWRGGSFRVERSRSRGDWWSFYESIMILVSFGKLFLLKFVIWWIRLSNNVIFYRFFKLHLARQLMLDILLSWSLRLSKTLNSAKLIPSIEEI